MYACMYALPVTPRQNNTHNFTVGKEIKRDQKGSARIEKGVPSKLLGNNKENKELSLVLLFILSALHRELYSNS